MSVSVDTLQIEIEATSSNAAARVNELATAIGNLRGSAKGGAGLRTVANQIKALVDATSGINSEQSAKIRELKETLNSLSGIQKAEGLASTINAIKKLPDMMAELAKVDMPTLAAQMEQVANAMRPLATEMQKVAAGFSAFPIRIQKIIASNAGLAASNKNVANSYTGLFGIISGGKIRFGVLWMMTKRLASTMGDWVATSNDYVENLNLFTVTMGEGADAALEYANAVQEALGIDASDWIRNQGLFKQITSGFGVVEEKANLMSKNLTQLGYDISSFYNISMEEAMQKLQSGIAGEIEPLRRLGYAIDVATLQQVAYEHGITQSVNTMNQAQKSQLRYLAIMEQSGNVMGDLSRTVQTPANAIRILQQQITQLSRALGNILIPMLQKVIPWVQAFVEVLTEAAQCMANLLGFELPTIDYSGLGGLSIGAEEAEDALNGATDAAKKLKNATLGIDELNIISNNTDSSSSSLSGGDLGINLPEYNFLGELTAKVDDLKEKAKTLLKVVGDVGLAFLTWKLGTDIFDSVFTLKEMLTGADGLSKAKTITLGVALAISGAVLEVDGIISAIEDGLNTSNAFETLAGGATFTAGGALIGKALGSAMIGGGVAAIIAGLPMFITGVYDAIVDGIDWLSAALTAVGATAAGAGIGAIIGALGGPIGAGIGALIGLAVGAITDFGIWLYQNWESVCEWLSGIGKWVDTNVVTPIVEFFRGLWDSVNEFFTQLWGDIQAVWSTVAEWFDTNVLTPISAAFKAATDWIGTFFDGCWLIVRAVWIVASDWFKANVTEPVKQWFEDVTEKVSGFFSDALQEVENTWVVVSNWFETTIIEPVRQKFQQITSKIAQFFSDAWTNVKGIWGTVTTWFTNTIINPVVQGFQTAVQKIRSAFENAFTGIKDFVKGIFNSVIGNVEGVINRVISGFNSLIGKFNNVVEWAADIVGTDWAGLKTFSLVSLPRLADGGFVNEGQLFIAREAGAELVGQIGNRTAVANNDQIVEGIATGVKSANDDLISVAYAVAQQIIQAINEKDTATYIDSRKITTAQVQRSRAMGV